MTDLKIEDLLANCKACDGKGSGHPPGIGKPMSPPVDCNECRGTGKTPTALGKVWAAFSEWWSAIHRS
jgi:DnaJ-class molecular chaperone